MGVAVTRVFRSCLGMAMLLLIAAPACALQLSFASAKEAQRILATRDEFIARLSPFDRAARMKSNRDISEPQFLKFVGDATLEWKQDEIARIQSAFQRIQPKVEALSLPLPARVDFIKTSGREEGHAAYTRQSAIILPVAVLSESDADLQRTIAHELFHISSRANPKLAKSLYPAIGFEYCGEIEFPVTLAPRKITNPDAPKNDYCIQLRLDGQGILAVPILLSRTPRYDVSRGGEFFQYLELALLLVEPSVGSGPPRALFDSRGPRLVTLQQVSGFFEQTGRNTDYVIHPEEVIADNFALLVLDQQGARSPEILARIRRALAEFAGAQPR